MLEPSDPLHSLWQHVLVAWGKPAAHDALLQTAVETERLEIVAKLYRAEEAQPEHAEVARRELHRIAAVALARLEAARLARVELKAARRSSLKTWVATLFVAALLLGLYSSFGSH